MGRRPAATSPGFVWANLVTELCDYLAAEPCDPVNLCVKYAYMMKTYYPSFRITVMFREDADKSAPYRLIMQEGFPVTLEELSSMVSENQEYMNPFLHTRKPRFLACDDIPQDIRNSRYGEACAAHIPICSSEQIYGWFTLSSTNASYVWEEKEKDWLAITGRICGAVVRTTINQRAAALEAPTATPQTASASLTLRERDVMACLRQGLTNRQIAKELGISEATARKHIENIYAKLNVSSRVQAIEAAKQLGLQ